MTNQATLRINVHEDKSKTFDVMLSDGPDGDNILEVNCDNEDGARALLYQLGLNGFIINPEFYNHYDS